MSLKYVPHVIAEQELEEGKKPAGFALSTLRDIEAALNGEKVSLILDTTSSVVSVVEVAHTILNRYIAKLGWCYWARAVVEWVCPEWTELGQIRAAVSKIEAVWNAKSAYYKAANELHQVFYLMDEKKIKPAGTTMSLEESRSQDPYVRRVMAIFKARNLAAHSQEENEQCDQLLSGVIRDLAIERSNGSGRFLAQAVEMLYYPFAKEENRENAKKIIAGYFVPLIRHVAPASPPARGGGSGQRGRGGLVSTKRPNTTSMYPLAARRTFVGPAAQLFVAPNLDAPSNAAVLLANKGYIDVALKVAQDLIPDDEINKQGLVQALTVGRLAYEAGEDAKGRKDKVQAALEDMQGLDALFRPLAQEWFAQGLGCTSTHLTRVLDKLTTWRFYALALKAIPLWESDTEARQEYVRDLARAEGAVCALFECSTLPSGPVGALEGIEKALRLVEITPKTTSASERAWWEAYLLRPHMEIFKAEVKPTAEHDALLIQAIRLLAAKGRVGEAVEMLWYPFANEKEWCTITVELEKQMNLAYKKDTRGANSRLRGTGRGAHPARPFPDWVEWHLHTPINCAVCLEGKRYFTAALRVAAWIPDDTAEKEELIRAITIGQKVQEGMEGYSDEKSCFSQEAQESLAEAVRLAQGVKNQEVFKLMQTSVYQGFSARMDEGREILEKLTGAGCYDLAREAVSAWNLTHPYSNEAYEELYRKVITRAQNGNESFLTIWNNMPEAEKRIGSI